MMQSIRKNKPIKTNFFTNLNEARAWCLEHSNAGSYKPRNGWLSLSASSLKSGYSAKIRWSSDAIGYIACIYEVQDYA